LRTQDNIAIISLRGKAWYTKFQQDLPTIRERRLPDLEERTDIYGDLAKAKLVIRALDFDGIELSVRSQLADYMVGRGWQIAVDRGKKYVENNYDFNDDYVVFSQ
jgi:hypothetical protein